jgi:hypothetical protein
MAENSADPLARHAGAKPLRRNFNPSISVQAMTLIGHIAVQWGALRHTLAFQVSFKRKHPSLPDELRQRPIRRETNHQIRFLCEAAQYMYANTRENAICEFNRIISDLWRVKGHRDKLAHGTFAKMDNLDPNAVVVHYKRRKHTYKLDTLLQIGSEIGQINGALLDFDMWANYETHKSLLEILEQ